MPFEVDELSSAERNAFVALTREHLGSAELEDRVVESLRERGLLYDESPSWRAPRWWRGVASVAAGTVLFVTGVLVGRQALPHPASAVVAQSTAGDTMSSAQLGRALQRVGTEYAALLAMLPVSDTAAIAFQVARNTLFAAARQVARRGPSDQVANEIIQAMATGGVGAGRSSNSMIVF